MKTKIVIFLIFFLLLVSTMKGVFGNPSVPEILQNLYVETKPLENGPELGRYMHLVALAKNHTYALTREMIDKGPDYGFYGGKYFSLFAPGVSYLTLPVFLIGQYFNSALLFTFGFVALISLINLILLYKISKEIFNLEDWIAYTVSIIFGFATVSLSYATTLYQHSFTQLCILGGFYAVWRYTQNTRFNYIWAIVVWIAYGLAIFFDYPNAVLLLPIMVYFLISAASITAHANSYKINIRKSFFLAFPFFAILIFAHLYHNHVYFGGWTKISSQIVSVKTLREAHVLDTSKIVSPLDAQAPDKGVGNFLKETNVPYSFYILLFATEKGLFIFSPIMILALWGIFKIRNKLSIEHLTLLALVLTNIFFYSSWGDPWGGWAFGPRYLIPSMAVLSIFIGIWIHSSRKLISKLLLLLFFAVSSAISLMGAMTTTRLQPSAETESANIKHSFLYNLDFLKQNKGASFIYNTYLVHKITLIEYYLIVYAFLLLIFLFIIFVLPIFEKKQYA